MNEGWGIDYSLRGQRVELIYTNDPYTKLRPGDRGTIKFELHDSLSVMWDSGSALSMRECDGDRFMFVEEEE